MLTVSTFILLHEKNNLASQFFVIISYYRFTYEIHKRLYVRASTHGANNLYSVTFLNYRFHTIGKCVQNYRYRLSTDMANIGPIPIPIIGQSLIIKFFTGAIFTSTSPFKSSIVFRNHQNT